MNEKDLIVWLSTNWPSVTAGAMSAIVFLRLWSFVSRLELLERRMRRIMRICSEQHEEQGARLFDDSRKDD